MQDVGWFAPQVSMIYAHDIEALRDVHAMSPVHVRCAVKLKNPIAMNPIQFYYRGVHQKLTPHFQQLVDRHWKVFCQMFMDTLWIVGVVPVTFVVLDDGSVVPRVPAIGTYSIGTYYDSLSEQQCYVVYRTNKAGSGLAQGLDHVTGSHNVNPLNFMGSARRQRGAGVGDVRRGPDQEDLGGLVRNEGLETGPSSYDPRSNLTRRMDLGVNFPGMMEPDRTMVVLSGFGYDPTLDGQMTSVVAASLRGKIGYDMYKHTVMLQEQKVATAIPYLESERPSAEYIQAMTCGEAPALDMDDQTNNTREKLYIREASQVAWMMAQQEMQQQRSKRYDEMGAGVGDISAISGSSGPNAALRACNQMGAYVDSTLAQQNRRQPYRELPAASHIVTTQHSVGGQHLVDIREAFEEQTCNLYELPVALFRNLASTQGNVDIQNGYLHATESKWVRTLTEVLTYLYNTLYGQADYHWELGWLYEYMLHREVVALVITQFDAAERSQRRTMLTRLLRSGRLDPRDHQRDHEDSTQMFDPRPPEIVGKSGPEQRQADRANTSTRKRDRYERHDLTFSEDMAMASVQRQTAKQRDRDASASLGKRKRRVAGDVPDTDLVKEQRTHRSRATNTEALTRPDGPDVAHTGLQALDLAGAHNVVDDEHDQMVKSLLSGTVHGAMAEPDEELADMSINEMFRAALETASHGTVMQLFEEGAPGQVRLDARRSARQRATGAAQEMQRKTGVNGSQDGSVVVTFTTNSALPMADLVNARVIGSMNRHEFQSQLRSRMNLPVQCDDGQQEDMLDRFAQFMAAPTVKKALQQTPLGDLFQMTEDGLRKQIEKARTEGAQEEKIRAKAMATSGGGKAKPKSKSKSK